MLVKVRVTPSARREVVSVREPDILEISVREEAAGNAANTRVRELVAMHYKVPLKAVRLVTGARSTSKKFNVVK
ncbi:MAG: DUF167 domain-containing protein [Patescibacteria group bacterium]